MKMSRTFAARASAFGEPVQVVPLQIVRTTLALIEFYHGDLQLRPIALEVSLLIIEDVGVDVRQLPISRNAEDVDAIPVPAHGIRLIKMNPSQSLVVVPRAIVALIFHQIPAKHTERIKPLTLWKIAESNPLTKISRRPERAETTFGLPMQTPPRSSREFHFPSCQLCQSALMVPMPKTSIDALGGPGDGGQRVTDKFAAEMCQVPAPLPLTVFIQQPLSERAMSGC